jgi:PAS domain S-box-containing protein
VIPSTDATTEVLREALSDADHLSDARHRQIVEEIAQGAVIVSPEGEILFANPSFAKLVGQSPRSLLQTTLESWVVAEDHARARALLSPDGHPAVELALLPDAGPRVCVRATVVSTSRDSTTLLFSELQAEEAEATLEAIRGGRIDALVVDGSEVVMLETASMPYRELVDQLRHGVLTVSDDGTITYANARFCALIELPRRDLVGTPVPQLVLEADHAKLAAVRAARSGAQADLRLRCSAGRIVPVQVSQFEHRGLRMLVFTDLPDRQRHLASEELSRKFLGLLAAEFHEMLGLIDDSVRALERAGHDAASRQAALESISRSTRLMGALVEDLRRINPLD